ncbi:MAG: hypothetical protein ACRDSR_13640 [Pseudonocardiaceae bacterium]
MAAAEPDPAPRGLPDPAHRRDARRAGGVALLAAAVVIHLLTSRR